MEDIVGTSACPELKSLIAFMGTRLDGKKILTESPDMITIHVKSYTGEFKCAPDCCYTFNIASSQTAKDLREKVATVVEWKESGRAKREASAAAVERLSEEELFLVFL